MILQWFCDLFYKVFSLLLGWINIPEIDLDTINSIDQVLEYILVDGGSLIGLLLPVNTCKTLLAIFIFIQAALLIYYLVMWILKKIPAVGISD